MKRIHLAIVAVAVMAVLVVAGTTLMSPSDSFPKKAVLKAEDMETIINVHGNWTQESLNTFEKSDPPYNAKFAAESGVRYMNDTASYGFGFLVAEMSSPDQADEQYHEFISNPNFQNSSFWIEISLDSLGDEAVMFKAPPISPLVGCWIIFHEGPYLVWMLGTMQIGDSEPIMLKLAEAQADRLP